MARALWKGSISFGLVEIPVALVTGTSDEGDISFAQVDRRNPKDQAFQEPASWSESFIATTRFEGGKLREVRLHPLDRKGGGGTRLAELERARQILASLQTLSRPFGTTITVEGATGVIRP